jgi:hypothetical protein
MSRRFSSRADTRRMGWGIIDHDIICMICGEPFRTIDCQKKICDKCRRTASFAKVDNKICPNPNCCGRIIGGKCINRCGGKNGSR